MNRILSYMFFLLLFDAVTLAAQNPLLFKKMEGLNSNMVYCVMQDSKGYIWIGTEAGAARCDGYTFTHYTIDEGLTDNDVFQIKEDSKGRLWFLTNNGKPCIYDQGRILNAANTSWLQQVQPQKLAIHFLQDKTGSIWFTTLDTAYHFINDAVQEKLVLPKSLSGNANILGLQLLNNDILLVHNYGVYNTATKANHFFDSSKHISNLHTRLLLNEKEVFYFVKNKLHVFSLADNSTQTIATIPPTQAFVVFMKTSHPDTVLVSTTYNVFKLNLRTRQFIQAPFKGMELITGILNDKEGNTWVSSLTQGLFLQKKRIPSATIKIGVHGLPESIQSTAINKIGSSIFIGFNDGHYISFTGKDTMHEQFNAKFLRNKVLQFYKGPRNMCFVMGNGVLLKSGHANAELYYNIKHVQAYKEWLYMATSTGLYKLPTASLTVPKVTTLKDVPVHITTQRTSELLVISADSILTGGILGLQLLVKEKTVAPLPWKGNITQGYTSKMVNMGNNQIAIATYNMGLGIIDHDTIYTINKSNGLLSNTCNSISVASDNSIWVATAKGINKISYQIKSNRSINYTIEDYSNRILLPTAAANDVLQTNDTLYIATDEGAFYHLLSKDASIKEMPAIYIESVQVNDSIYSFQSSYQLAHHQNKIRINFIGLSFQSEGKIRYRYKLEPIDTGWQQTENTFVEYPFLAAGKKYTFIVTAALPNGNWNPVSAIVQINIPLPFWKTGWFIVTTIAILLLIFLLIAKSIIRNIKRKHALQQKQLTYEKQLLQLEQQALSLQMNPHFIFNAMNAIKGFYAAANKQAANEYIDKFASLMRMMLEKNAQPTIALQDEIAMLTSYLELATIRQEKKFVFDISVANGINTLQLHIPAMLVQPFVENAVQHGIAPLASGGKIKIAFSLQVDMLICTVEDNGIGRKQSAQIHKYALHQSRGITITEQRLLLLSPKSKLLINDIMNEVGQAAGTKVTLQLPLLFKGTNT